MDEQTLNDLLECSVCLERLDTDSKVLPCQHTFCRKCLEDIVSSKHELRCPECRILVKLRVEDLPSNVLLMRILGGLKHDVPNKEIVYSPPPSACPERVPNSPQTPPVTKPDADSTPQPQLPAQQIMSRPVLGAPLPHKYLPQNVCHAKALFDFQSNISGDLAFKKNDVIVLRRRVDQNWFYGHLNGREGAFPVNHVQIIVPLPVPQCRAVFDFRMGPNEEEGCLSFSKGQIISVIRRVDQNWAEGRIGECIGIFPINFVEMNSLAKQLMGGDKESGRSSLGEAMTTAAQAPTPTTAIDSNTHAPQRLPPMPAKVETHNYPVVRRAPPHANLLLQGMNNSSAVRRHSAEILNPVVSTPPKASVAEANRKSMISLSAAGESPRLLPYVAVFSYKPQKPDELELIKGAHYYVSERCQDGWLRGMNSARKAGVFPGNHVVPIKELPPSPGVVPDLNNANNTPHNQRLSNSNTPSTPSSTPSTPNSPPILPPRNQASTADQLLEAVSEKKDSINLIKRITNNLKRSKSPPAAAEENGGPSATTTPRPNQAMAQPRLLQSVHNRSGSCPSQLLDLSALKVTPVHTNNAARHVGLTVNLEAQNALSFGSQRVRGQKERPSLHNIHRQLGERKEDLTALGPQQSSSSSSSHKKSNSLDAGRIISGPSSSTSTTSSGATDQNGNTRSSSNGRSGASSAHHHQVKEKFRCIVAYPPNSEYELELNVGDLVLVNKKRENGWYRGVHLRNGKSGLFPASFVEPAT